MSEQNGTTCRCGAPSTSPYCPTCGRRQTDKSSVEGLLAFCIKTRESKLALVEKYTEKSQLVTGDSEIRYWLDRADKNKVAYGIWSAWCTELADLMKVRTDAQNGMARNG